MANDREFVVDGFAFHTRKEAEKAQKELEGIQYLKKKIDGQEPEKIIQVYHKVMEQQLFETPVGLYFIKELQEELRKVPYLMEDAIPPIDIPKGTGLRTDALKQIEEDTSLDNAKKEKKDKQAEFEQEKTEHKLGLKFSVFINILLLLVVIGMFAISMTSNNINILNYQNKIIDKYESWEQELEQREATVKEYEEKYGIQ